VTVSRRARFEVFRGADGQWYWRALGGNGEITAQSEGYVTRSNARRAVAVFRRRMAEMAADSGADYGTTLPEGVAPV